MKGSLSHLMGGLTKTEVSCNGLKKACTQFYTRQGRKNFTLTVREGLHKLML